MSTKANKVALLFGGRSNEREISLRSGNCVLEALQRLGYEVGRADPKDRHWLDSLIAFAPDVVFVALHGGEGEDGTIQDLLASKGLVFTGTPSLASALCFSKLRSKVLLDGKGELCPMGYQWSQEIHAKFPFPVIVKPSECGSSIAVFKVRDDHSFYSSCVEASRHGPVLYEPCLPGIDVFQGFIGDTMLPPIAAYPVGEFFDYRAKYQDERTRYEIDAGLTPAQIEQLSAISWRIVKHLGVTQFGRVDYRFCQGEFYFLELNTVPGLTPTSLLPRTWLATGKSYDDMIRAMVDNAFNEKAPRSYYSINQA